MNDEELTAKVNSAMYKQCRNRGYAAPVDVLLDIGVLTKQKYEDWRFGKITYLESVCNVSLRKLSLIMHRIRVYAKENNLKPSFCYYKRWGMKKKPAIPLRFSKSGNADIERWYATHWVDANRVKELKEAKTKQEHGQE